MAEPITIKKRKLTIRSKASAATPDADAASSESTTDADAQETHAAALNDSNTSALDYINKAAPAAVAKQPSYLIFAILALIATLIFIYIVIIQWTEFSFLQSAFPRPIQTGY